MSKVSQEIQEREHTPPMAHKEPFERRDTNNGLAHIDIVLERCRAQDKCWFDADFVN